jgi:hypothetical protein
MKPVSEIALHTGILMGLLSALENDAETVEYFGTRGYRTENLRRLQKELRDLAEIFYIDPKEKQND